MTSPAPSAVAAEAVAERRGRRRRRRTLDLVVGLLVVVAVAFASSACTPTTVAKMAIRTYWGNLTPCAERIVQRESRFQADAVNPSSGTTGLFQLHPVHAPWIRSTYGYRFYQMTDAWKNARVARGLFDEARRYWGDGWQPWRLSGQPIRNGGCPA